MNRVKPKGANIEILPLSLPIYQQHKDMQLYIELFFCEWLPFSINIKKVNFITAKPFISRTTSHITKSIDTVLDLYESRGFNISDVHIDNKFNIKTLKVHLITIFTHIYVKK